MTATGFVEDLTSELAGAHVAVAPLRQGAGVKFKTVEALLHGVPVVATSSEPKASRAPTSSPGSRTLPTSSPRPSSDA